MKTVYGFGETTGAKLTTLVKDSETGLEERLSGWFVAKEIRLEREKRHTEGSEGI